jgi:hypothetical protein
VLRVSPPVRPPSTPPSQRTVILAFALIEFVLLAACVTWKLLHR